MSRFHVQRSIEIEATPETVYEQVANFNTWRAWSPWLRSEPDAEVTVSDDPESVGSLYQWKGNVVGQGEIEHRQLKPGRRIEDEIRFIKPFQSKSTVVFDFEPTEQGTRATWQMDGALPWFLFWMSSQMKAMIAVDYDRGLKMLKEWIETGQVLSKTKVLGVEQVGPIRMAGVYRTCSFQEASTSMADACTKADQLLAEHGLPTDGQMITVYHHMDLKAQKLVYTGGRTLPPSVAEATEALHSWSCGETKALCVEHVGRYEHLNNGWSAAHQHVQCKRLKQNRINPFEIYINDPGSTATEDRITRIYMPVR